MWRDACECDWQAAPALIGLSFVVVLEKSVNVSCRYGWARGEIVWKKALRGKFSLRLDAHRFARPHAPLTLPRGWLMRMRAAAD